ncbi:MAG TPA: glycosyltransferase family 2 protein [Polyangiaceae bacterium]|jgi:dolichol-phosphate mannosyltransferase|nr:glycosyltransferase family 2 protein [Polyangiaceae bacterium]
MTRTQRPKLSIVIPLFNEQEVIEELRRRLLEVLNALPDVGPAWEVLFIDDGSTDASLDLLTEFARVEPRFRVLALSRNFGHQAAVTAGLDRAEGDHVVLMDADLQDPPEVIPEMLGKAQEGYDVVYGTRNRRHGEGFFKRCTAAIFYRLMRAVTGVNLPVDTGDFRLMVRAVVLTLRALREQHRFVRGMVSWVGFRQTAVLYDRDARHAGETKYPLRRMLRFASDGATSFSIVPLRLATWLGLILALIAVLGGVTAVGIKIFLPEIVLPGWTAIIVAVAFGFSAQLLITGILGEYVGRIYEEVKRRPLYVSRVELNFESNAPSDESSKSSTNAESGAPERR